MEIAQTRIKSKSLIDFDSDPLDYQREVDDFFEDDIQVVSHQRYLSESIFDLILISEAENC